MTTVTGSADCGNSPKNKAIETLAIALEGGEWSANLITGATCWSRADGSVVVGADAILLASRTAPAAIRIDRVTSHGKAGAVSGLTDGEAFAHILTFTSASARQLATIDSFRKTEKPHG